MAGLPSAARWSHSRFDQLSHRNSLVRKTGRQPDTIAQSDSPTRCAMTSTDEHGEFAGLLEQVRDGDQHAFDLLLAKVYDTLKQIARRQLSLRRRGSALCTTELVHEAYFKL